MMTLTELLTYALAPFAVLFLIIEWRLRRRERENRRLLEQASRLGLDQPISLHPSVDPNRCIGSGACVSACPEKNVLGIINGQANLINGSACIGHGACAAACPIQAISLVFGTAERGIDIPRISPQFETNVSGLYVAGEVGGMGLIRNAVEQGRQAVEAIVASLEGAARADDGLDLIIVGGGPAGLSAARQAGARGLRYLVCEQEDPGGAVLHYPRGKIILTRPVAFPEMPVIKGPRLSKEQLMDIVETAAGPLNLRRRAPVTHVQRVGDHFEVEIGGEETLRAQRVLLAVGRRGSPRKLGVPGEELGKVVYQLKEPERYEGQHVMVVGGGNSAAEAALMLADAPRTTVQLSYRKANFNRVAPETRTRLAAAAEAGRVELLLNTEVQQITIDTVHLSHPDGPIERENTSVIVQIGGTLPTAFLRKIGILVDVHRGAHIEPADAPA